MGLTSKTGYAFSALFDLAFHAQGRAVQAKEMAERQGIPLRYLEQILRDLRRGGFVEAKRGPRGGYALLRPAAEIRLDEVVAAVDEPVEKLFSWGERKDGEAGGEEARLDVSTLFWRALGSDVARLFSGVTVKQLVDRAESLGVPRATAAPQMYFI